MPTVQSPPIRLPSAAWSAIPSSGPANHLREPSRGDVVVAPLDDHRRKRELRILRAASMENVAERLSMSSSGRRSALRRWPPPSPARVRDQDRGAHRCGRRATRLRLRARARARPRGSGSCRSGRRSRSSPARSPRVRGSRRWLVLVAFVLAEQGLAVLVLEMADTSRLRWEGRGDRLRGAAGARCSALARRAESGGAPLARGAGAGLGAARRARVRPRLVGSRLFTWSALALWWLTAYLSRGCGCGRCRPRSPSRPRRSWRHGLAVLRALGGSSERG